jgi:hypothetical protein
MRSFDEIKLEIHKLYSELGKDPQDLRGWEEDFGYKVQRISDLAVTWILRKDVDDYFGSGPGKYVGKKNIIEALNDFKLPK